MASRRQRLRAEGAGVRCRLSAAGRFAAVATRKAAKRNTPSHRGDRIHRASTTTSRFSAMCRINNPHIPLAAKPELIEKHQRRVQSDVCGDDRNAGRFRRPAAAEARELGPDAANRSSFSPATTAGCMCWNRPIRRRRTTRRIAPAKDISMKGACASR